MGLEVGYRGYRQVNVVSPSGNHRIWRDALVTTLLEEGEEHLSHGTFSAFPRIGKPSIIGLPMKV